MKMGCLKTDCLEKTSLFMKLLAMIGKPKELWEPFKSLSMPNKQ